MEFLGCPGVFVVYAHNDRRVITAEYEISLYGPFEMPNTINSGKPKARHTMIVERPSGCDTCWDAVVEVEEEQEFAVGESCRIVVREVRIRLTD
jgi:hypothetical protein